MRRRWGLATLAALMPVAVLASTAGATQAATADDDCQKPQVMVLETLKPERTGTVQDINASGLAVGVSGQQPVYWTTTKVHQVPLPAGYNRGQVMAVNRDGLMVGWFTASTDSQNHTPFSYQAGAPAATLLPTVGEVGQANDIDDSGRIVGTVDGTDRGAVWQDGQLLATLTLADDLRITDVTSINSAGAVVANGRIWNYYMEDYQDVVLLWESFDGPPKVVGPPIGPGLQGWGRPALDDQGRVVGSLLSSIEATAVHWDPPGYDTTGEVAPLPGFNSGQFTATSPHTQLAAGIADMRDSATPKDQAQIWPGNGPALALPRLAADQASHAYAASDNGSVGGEAVNAAGVVKPVVWTCALSQGYVPEG